jgi:hypothetical protein
MRRLHGNGGLLFGSGGGPHFGDSLFQVPGLIWMSTVREHIAHLEARMKALANH